MYSLGGIPYPSMAEKQLKTFLNTGQRMDKPKLANEQLYVFVFSINHSILVQIRTNAAMLERTTK